MKSSPHVFLNITTIKENLKLLGILNCLSETCQSILREGLRERDKRHKTTVGGAVSVLSARPGLLWFLGPLPAHSITSGHQI